LQLNHSFPPNFSFYDHTYRRRRPVASRLLLQTSHDFGDIRIGSLQFERGCAGSKMTAASKIRHQLTDVHAAGAVKDGVADNRGYPLFLRSPVHPDRHIYRWKQGINQKTVARRDSIQTTKIADHDIAFLSGIFLGDAFELDPVFSQKVHSASNFG